VGRGRMREQKKDLYGSRDTSYTPLTPRHCVNTACQLPGQPGASPGPLSAIREGFARTARGFLDDRTGRLLAFRRSPTCDDDATNSTNPKSEPTLKPMPVPTPGPSGPSSTSPTRDRLILRFRSGSCVH